MDVYYTESAPELTDNPNLHLVTVSGRVLKSVRVANGFAMFMIPAGIEQVYVASRTSRSVAVEDVTIDARRELGVQVSEITFCDSNVTRRLDSYLTTADLPGWCPIENEANRWTRGYALLTLGERKRNSIALLGIRVTAAGPYELAADDTRTGYALQG